MARPVASEHAEQVAVIQWWDRACRVYGFPPYVLMAIPNAGKRSYAAAAWMKAEGLRSGVPDMFLAIPRVALGGLWIEMKRGKNKPDAKQEEVMAYLSLRYAVRVCYSAEEAIATIKEWMK